MILRHFLALILCSSLAFGQAAATMPPAQAAAPSSTPDTAAALSPDAAVITVKGVCDPPAATDCNTVITKAQFEAIIAAFPQMKSQQRQVASSYGQLLTMSAEAKKRSLDKSPRVQVRTKISDMQALAGELRDTMQDDAGKVSDADAQKYYDDHKSNYEQAEVQRLIIPKEPQPATKDDDKDADAPKTAAKKPLTAAAKAAAAKAGTKAAPAKPKAMDEAGLAALAAKLRTRAAAGEDFSKLQAEAFAAANIKGGAPDTKISKATRAQLPPNVFDLKTGDVSELIPDARAFFVFKMGAKTTVSLDDAKSDVKTALKNERLQSSLKSVSDSSTTTLNDAYFGPEPAPSAAPGGRQPASAPPSN